MPPVLPKSLLHELGSQQPAETLPCDHVRLGVLHLRLRHLPGNFQLHVGLVASQWLHAGGHLHDPLLCQGDGHLNSFLNPLGLGRGRDGWECQGLLRVVAVLLGVPGPVEGLLREAQLALARLLHKNMLLDALLLEVLEPAHRFLMDYGH